MKKLNFNSYDYLIVDNITDAKAIKKINKIVKNNKVFIITDDNVLRLHKESLKIFKNYEIISIKPGDEEKNIKNYEEISTKLLNLNINKKDIIVAFGGGVVLDLAGFVAASIKRGIKRINIPTTIVGQIDASIGGKVALNLSDYKNQLGFYKNPDLVISSQQYLETLDQKEIDSGLGELLKVAIIGSASLYKKIIKDRNISKNYIYEAVNIKKEIVTNDYYEKNQRLLLNLGHTFGHAIESYTNFKTPHGIAVLEGLKLCLEAGNRLSITPNEIKDKMLSDIKSLGVTLNDYKFEDLKPFIYKDKKAKNDKLAFVFIEDIENISILEVSIDNLDDLLS